MRRHDRRHPFHYGLDAGSASGTRARSGVPRDAKRPLVVAHEEALLFLQHVVLLHGSDTSTNGPTDAEVAFWLLGASDHLGEWAKPDDAAMSNTERLAAELIKTHRFNRSEDSVRTALRTDGISARIDMLRRGDFEDRGVLRGARVHPVIVTYDDLCENQMLYAWVTERCQHHGLLQQPNIGKPVLAVVQDYERLLGVAARGGSVVKLLEKRLTRMWKDERVEVIMGESNAPLRLPGTELEYATLIKRMGPRIGIPHEKSTEQPS